MGIKRTYTEAQYSTPSGERMILRWLDGEKSEERIEVVAKYMSRVLRIGGIKDCRALVCGAIRSGEARAVDVCENT